MSIPTFSTTSFNLYLNGVRVTCGNLGDTHEITETYIIEDKAAGGLVDVACADLEAMFTESAMPKIGDVYVSRTPGTASDMFVSNARLNDYSIEAGAKNTALLSLRYTTLYLANNPANEPILPSSIEYSTQSRMTELFRTDYSTPAPSGLDASTTDIGGTPYSPDSVSLKGKIIEVWQTAIRVRIVRDASKVGSEMSEQVGDDIGNYVGCRNLTLFLGLQPKTVECRGVSAQKLDNEFYEIVYDFVYDTFAWHDQSVMVNPNGEPKFNTAGDNYEKVLWKRDVKDTAEFNNIWPVTAQKDYAKKGWW